MDNNEENVLEYFKEVENKLFGIFQKVTAGGNLAIAELDDLNAELIKITTDYYDYYAYLMQKYKSFYSKRELFFHNRKLTFSLCTVMSFLNPIAIWSLVMFFYFNAYFKKDPIHAEELFEIDDRIQILMENCTTFLHKSITNLIAESDGIDLDAQLLFTEANRVIQKYLDTGELEEVDIDTYQFMIFILQYDLGTKEENLEILLQQAKMKLADESPQKTRKLTQKV